MAHTQLEMVSDGGRRCFRLRSLVYPVFVLLVVTSGLPTAVQGNFLGYSAPWTPLTMSLSSWIFGHPAQVWFAPSPQVWFGRAFVSLPGQGWARQPPGVHPWVGREHPAHARLAHTFFRVFALKSFDEPLLAVFAESVYLSPLSSAGAYPQPLSEKKGSSVRRSKLEIYLDVLGACAEHPLGLAEIARVTGLNFRKAKECVDALAATGLLSVRMDNGRRVYSQTGRGRLFVRRARRLLEG